MLSETFGGTFIFRNYFIIQFFTSKLEKNNLFYKIQKKKEEDKIQMYKNLLFESSEEDRRRGKRKREAVERLREEG